MRDLDQDFSKLEPKDFLDQKTLVLGEVKQGKTALVTHLLNSFLAQGQNDIAVMDLAPDLIKGVGGKMELAPKLDIKIYSPTLIAPRLTGKTEEQVLAFAQQNGDIVDQVFIEYLKTPAQVLFINDTSMYLQSRKPEKLLPVLEITPTVIMNSYFGKSLGGGDLGALERKRVLALKKYCQKVINL